jgi:hypothetical protein
MFVERNRHRICDFLPECRRPADRFETCVRRPSVVTKLTTSRAIGSDGFGSRRNFPHPVNPILDARRWKALVLAWGLIEGTVCRRKGCRFGCGFACRHGALDHGVRRDGAAAEEAARQASVLGGTIRVRPIDREAGRTSAAAARRPLRRSPATQENSVTICRGHS